jgi:hypothetical protein
MSTVCNKDGLIRFASEGMVMILQAIYEYLPENARGLYTEPQSCDLVRAERRFNWQGNGYRFNSYFDALRA